MGGSYDANGNDTSQGNYDIENRLAQGGTYGNSHQYSYAPGNKRVWRGLWTANPTTGDVSLTTDEVTFWSVTGQKLASYSVTTTAYVSYPETQPSLFLTTTGANEYFGGKLIRNSTGNVVADRLGSIGKYYPYGQERPSATANGKEKFATYFRDSETGLDYADQRYESPGTGRFLTPDPYVASGGPAAPGSWNRYAYASGDPVNGIDPRGLETCFYVDGNLDSCEEDDNPPEPKRSINPIDWCDIHPEQCLAFKPKDIPTLTFGGSIVPLFNKAFSSAFKDVTKSACARDFATSSAGLQSYLERATYQYFPIYNRDLTSPDYGKYDPTKDAVANPAAQEVTINTAGHFAAYVGDELYSITNNGQQAALTGNQYRTFILLHELGHLAGLETFPDANNYDNIFNRNIIQDCIGVKFKSND